MNRGKPSLLDQRFAALGARLREPQVWFPYPFIIAFGLVLLLTAHILTGTNPRTGNPADIIAFPSQTVPDSAIWLSVTPIGRDIVVTTGERKVFRWRQDVRKATELAPFIAYLKAQVATEIETAAISKRILPAQTRAVIAADQHLKYVHLRPLIHALAAAGIAQYAFETQNPRTGSWGATGP